MSILTLSNGQATLVDPEDLSELQRYAWLCLGGYAVRKVTTASGGSTLIYLHRQLLRARPGEVVDHVNNNRLDNRRANLRLCSPSENLANRPSPRPDTYRGVYFERRGCRWRAQIKIRGKNKYLGTFPTAELAALAYDAAALQEWGRFARLNFPERAVEQLPLTLPLAEQPDDDPFDVPAPAHWPAVDGFEIVVRNAWRRSRPAAASVDLSGYDAL